MANVKWSALTSIAAADFEDTDSPVGYDSSGNVGARFTWANIKTYLGLSNFLNAGTTKNLTAGFTCTQYNTYGTAGVVSTGTVTPSPANGSEHKYTNGGAHTLAPFAPTAGTASAICVEITNNGSAGTITTSGFTKVSGSFTTTNGHEFKCFIHVGDAGSYLNIVALQ